MKWGERERERRLRKMKVKVSARESYLYCVFVGFLCERVCLLYYYFFDAKSDVYVFPFTMPQRVNSASNACV
jgi:hypothetical protein